MINDGFLDEAREVPSVTPMERVVAWFVFRSREDARQHLEHVYLAAGQGLVGGCGRDSVRSVLVGRGPGTRYQSVGKRDGSE
ncbi:hypothetical protein ACSDBR_12585 [Acidithiobacillus ferriphilus]|uniref:hypothetical protein n=1 Tax=Acidithiobacillus ferriphilus TaxID=1689834 RepID=UPI003F50DF11